MSPKKNPDNNRNIVFPILLPNEASARALAAIVRGDVGVGEVGGDAAWKITSASVGDVAPTDTKPMPC